MSAPIAVVGSLNVDFVLTMRRFPASGETLIGNDFSVFPGGKGANQAYAVAKLGGAVRMIGQVGNDAHADWLKQHLASAGVDVAGIATDPNVSTGIAFIAIDAAGQNQIVIVPGANGTFAAVRLRPLAAKIVLLQLEIPMATVVAAARSAHASGATVVLDPAPAQELPAELLPFVHYLTPNETELRTLTGAPGALDRAEAIRQARLLRERGARSVIVKLGAAGALLVGDGREHFWPALPVDAVDTTAAGDAFNGAFAAALAAGDDEITAGRFATAAAACSVTRRGAQPSMPTRAEVTALLNK
ncbi:MAG: ribokinase [Gemmataceae bacterium]|nr:ribokinase [Gemmataceae bacterium]